MSDSKPESYSPESWEFSRNYASLLGEIPSSFTSTIRSLILDFEKNNNTISNGSRYLATRLVRSGNMKAPFYYATTFFKPDILINLPAVTDNDLIKIYKPDEIATLFGIIYLFKKIKKYCDPTELSFVLPAMHKDISISGLVGMSIRGIGLSNGLLTFGMRYVALATFLKHNIKHFQEYRRLLKNANRPFNLEKEVEYFGCTTSQIASIFMQTLGYGINASNNLAMALSNDALIARTMPDTSPFKVADLWTRTLIDSGHEPKITHDTKFYPENEAALKNLISKTAVTPIQWLEKAAEDISPQTTPKLFSASPAKAEPTPPPQEVSAEIADDLDEIDDI